MLKTIIDEFKAYNLDLNNQKVVIGVSTGVDSMTLLHLLEQAQLGCEIIVCHVNHGKREQSQFEEAYIRQYCDEHHLQLYVLALSKDDFSQANFQEEARKLRYEFFYRVMDEVGSKILLLAHHLNDDMETMLMRLIRGSNLKGYAGIEQYQVVNNKIIFRPLLHQLKVDIIKFAQENNIKYFDDYTNFTDLYTRNRIRQHIIPALFSENELVHLKFIEYKNTLSQASKIINSIRDEAIEKMIKPIDKGVTFKKDEFLTINQYMQIEILFEVLKSYALSKKNIEEIIKYINSEKPNLNIHYKNITFVKEYNDIFLYFYERLTNDVYLEINALGKYPINENYYLEVSKNLNKCLPNLNIVWYNSNKFPFIIRTRRDGDKMNFRYGTKKVKKILIDNKVGILKRDQVLVLEKDKNILAVFGYAKSDHLPKLDECDIVIELKENHHDN